MTRFGSQQTSFREIYQRCDIRQLIHSKTPIPLWHTFVAQLDKVVFEDAFTPKLGEELDEAGQSEALSKR